MNGHIIWKLILKTWIYELLYVIVTHVIFQYIINHVQIQCFELVAKVDDELETQFLAQDVINATLRLVHPQYC
jgi:hypothetical protein